MKVGDLVRKHRNINANQEPWWSHGLLTIGVVIGPAKTTDFTILWAGFTILWAGKYRTYEHKNNLEVVQERK